MAVRALPDHPDLDHLRKEARRLQRRVRAGDAAGVAAVRQLHPTAGDLAVFPLADAQLVLARSYGFPSWPRLRQHLRTIALYSRSPHRQPVGGPIHGPDDLADEFLRLACLTYGGDDVARHRRARELLAEHPGIARHSIHTIAAVGDVAGARALLASDPAQARREGGPHAWEPLLYLAYSRLDSGRLRHSTLEVARQLLGRGADPNAGYLWEGLTSPFTALTGAFGGGEDAINQPPHQHATELARLLLEAGADPNDSQVLYNRHFEPSNEHLELLFAYGLGRGDGGPWHERLAPSHPTPAQMVEDQLLWAASDNLVERVRLLVRSGVHVDGLGTNAAARGGRTAYEMAMRNGNTVIAALLLEGGAAAVVLEPVQRLVAACMAGDGAAVHALLAGAGDLGRAAAAARPDALIEAARLGRLESVRLLAGLGFDPNAVRRTSALHEAAGRGDLPMVELLLAVGADPSVVDREFGATPLGWALHGGHDDAADHLAGRTPERPSSTE